MRQFDELATTINTQHSIKITESLSLAWQAFKKQPGQYVAFLLAIIMVSIVLSLIPFAGSLLSPFFVLGFSSFLHERNLDGEVAFNDFLKPFQKFGNVIITYLLTLVVYIVACVPLFIFGGMQFFQQIIEAQQHPYDFHPVISGTLILAIVVVAILCIIAAVLLTFATFFAYFFPVTPIEAIKLSIKMGWKNFGHIAMLLIFSGVVAASGVIAIIAGLLVTVPLAYLMMYFTFAGITKLETGDEPEFDFEKGQGMN